MDIVLGVSMAPASVQMVLLQGEYADGATIDENELPIPAADDSPTVSASDRVIAAIMCTREDAAGAGLELDSIGVACTDQLEAAAIRDALAAHKIENVLLVSAFVAATALTQFVGGAMGYERTAVLFVEPDTATLAVVETSDGSIDEVHQEQLHTEPGQIVGAELMDMVAGLDELATRPGGLFVVGSGVDVAPIKSRLEEATSLTVNVAEEPETALARGAALASANALTSPTAVLAYAQDPGTGVVDVSAGPEYLSIADAELGDDDLAYSAVADDEADAPTIAIDAPDGSQPRPRPGLLVGTVVAVAGFSAALALEIALSLGIRTTVGSLPAPIQNIIAPVQEALAPAPAVAAMKMQAPTPLSPPPVARPPVAPIPAAPPVLAPAVPVPPAPAMPVPVIVLPIAPAPAPPIELPNPPASPPAVQAPPHPSPPSEPPPIYVPPPPKAPPPHRPPPGQGPPPNPGGAGPVNGPGPTHGNPGAGGPHGGGPVDGPGHGGPNAGRPESGTPPGSGGPHGGGPVDGPSPGHGTPGGGTPGGGPPESGTPPGAGGPHGGGPVGGGESPGGAGESHGGGPVGGGEAPGGAGESHGGGGSGESPSGGGESHGGGGGESPSGGASSSGGSSSSGGESGGGSSSSGSSSSSGGSSSSGSESSGGSSSSGSSSSSGGESGGSHH